MTETNGATDVCILLDRTAAARPDAPAMTVDDETMTYGQLRERSLRAASMLNGLGVVRDDIVAVPMHNSFEQTAIFFGAWRLGATPLALSPKFPDSELDRILEVAEAKVCLKEGQDLESPPLWTGPYQTASRFKAQTSGGSTGVPKVLVDTNPSMIDVEGTAWRWGYNKGPAMFAGGPTYHSGPMNHMTECLARGLHFITMRKFDAQSAVGLITRHRPHWALFVPTMMNRILKLPSEALEGADFSCLKYVWHSAASCPAWLKQEWIDLVGPEAVWEIFGGSEGCATTIISGTEWLEHRGSVGRAASGEIAIYDEEGKPVPNGQVGEIYMRDLLRPRRFQVTTQVKRRLLGDWESFGDLGWLDDDGYLFLADRRVDMINSGGENIYPAEVEAAIQSHPDVSDAVVFGAADADLGEIVCAQVWTPHRTISKEELLEYLRTRIVRYKIPRRLSFTDGPIRNDAGKVRRSELAIPEEVSAS